MVCTIENMTCFIKKQVRFIKFMTRFINFLSGFIKFWLGFIKVSTGRLKVGWGGPIYTGVFYTGKKGPYTGKQAFAGVRGGLHRICRFLPV